MPNDIVTINLEDGLPSLEEARLRLKIELANCRNRKVKAAKIIHGYGSSGVGGTLRQGVRKSLIARRKEGQIRAVVFGENWTVFDAQTRALLEECPGLSRDSDLCSTNPGISVVLL